MHVRSKSQPEAIAHPLASSEPRQINPRAFVKDDSRIHCQGDPRRSLGTLRRSRLCSFDCASLQRDSKLRKIWRAARSSDSREREAFAG